MAGDAGKMPLISPMLDQPEFKEQEFERGFIFSPKRSLWLHVAVLVNSEDLPLRYAIRMVSRITFRTRDSGAFFTSSLTMISIVLDAILALRSHRRETSRSYDKARARHAHPHTKAAPCLKSL